MLTQAVKRRVGVIFSFVALLWLIEIINILSDRALNDYGLLPRTWEGLLGIFFAPFLHGGVWHLLSNSIPLIILGIVLIAHGTRKMLSASLIIIVLGGLLVWFFGRYSYHIGASGLVFGWWSFLIALGFYQRDWKALLSAFIVLIFYGGMFLGLFVIRPHISFEGHIFGAIAGVVAAAFLAKRKS